MHNTEWKWQIYIIYVTIKKTLFQRKFNTTYIFYILQWRLTRPECPKNIEFSSSNLFLFVKGWSRFTLFLFSRFSLLIFEVDKLVDKEQQGDDDTWRKICINANPIGLNCKFYQVPTWWRCLRCSKSRTSQFLNECYTPSN